MFLDPYAAITWTAILLLTISTFFLGVGWRNNAANIAIISERVLLIEKAINPLDQHLPEVPRR